MAGLRRDNFQLAWCVSMIFRLTVNPKPKPTLRVVKNGAGAFCAASAVKPEPLS